MNAKLQELVARASTGAALERIAEWTTFGADHAICLGRPDFTQTILTKERTVGPDCHQAIFRSFSHLPGERSSNGSETDEGWKRLIATVEEKARTHAADPELGPLYEAAARHERHWCERMCEGKTLEDDLEN